jgi:hypothetical protein
LNAIVDFVDFRFIYSYIKFNFINAIINKIEFLDAMYLRVRFIRVWWASQTINKAINKAINHELNQAINQTIAQTIART